MNCIGWIRVSRWCWWPSETQTRELLTVLIATGVNDSGEIESRNQHQLYFKWYIHTFIFIYKCVCVCVCVFQVSNPAIYLEVNGEVISVVDCYRNFRMIANWFSLMRRPWYVGRAAIGPTGAMFLLGNGGCCFGDGIWSVRNAREVDTIRSDWQRWSLELMMDARSSILKMQRKSSNNQIRPGKSID